MSGDHAARDEQRRKQNEISKAWAHRKNQPWNEQEDEIILDEWILVPAGRRDEMGLSHRLERSIYAIQRRAQELRLLLGVQTEEYCVSHTSQEKPYIGALDDPEDQWWK